MSKKQLTLRMILVVVLATFLASESTVLLVSGRYLPTRSQDDKIERLREILKELLESQNVNSRSQPDLNYDQGIVEGTIGTGGIGSSGRTILFKRDIEQFKSPMHSRVSIPEPFKGPL